MKEKWVDVEGFVGLYQVSNLGKVISTVYKTPKVIKGRKTKDDYVIIPLSGPENNKNIYLHRLVADHFVKKTKKDIELGRDVVYFKDGNRKNVVATNLKWGTRSEVLSNSLKGKKHSRSVLTDEQVLEIKKLIATTDISNADLAEKYSTTMGNISLIRNNHRHTNVEYNENDH